MRILLIGLLFISNLLSLQAQPKEEIRAIWLTTLGGMDWPTRKANSAKGIEAQKNELIRQLDALKAANFNTILFQTRLRDCNTCRQNDKSRKSCFCQQICKSVR